MSGEEASSSGAGSGSGGAAIPYDYSSISANMKDLQITKTSHV